MIATKICTSKLLKEIILIDLKTKQNQMATKYDTIVRLILTKPYIGGPCSST
jgi:hypothetical protein